MRILLPILAGLTALVGSAQPTAPVTPGFPEAASAAEVALAQPELAAYRGWLKFLRFEAETAVARSGAASAPAADKISRLVEWTRRITADPQLLGKLRGVQEWAYESPVDGSGQPFKIVIPTDYDPERRPAPPLSLYMHGYTGDHLNHSANMKDHAGYFEVAVLGRARGGLYVALSEADVLHALDYVEAHWRIDTNRIHLAGGSMGGSGTFRLGARYPHRFASGQITCGYLQQDAIGNLLTFPIYATHSDDDPVVPILLSRGPLSELRRRGGQAIFDETTGLGHAAWDYAAGNARAEAWAANQVLPESRTVRHLDFTATDGAAPRCWWAEIVEWGPLSRPARFIATAGANNTLYVELDNVARLRLRLPESPFDPSQPLQVVVAGQPPYSLAAPLSPEVIIPGDASAGGGRTAPARSHTPGGPLLVYDGSPLLIVYGTSGDAATVAALRTAATAASQSSSPLWALDSGDADPRDNIPHSQNLFGRLRTKADTEVTDADLTSGNLVLIGSAAENTIVARLAPDLPVRLEGGNITCSDGFTLPAFQRTLGLVALNPLAMQRLVYWIASTEPAGYAPDAAVTALATPLFIGADLLITQATGRQLVATRSFDSRWRWLPDRDRSPIVCQQPQNQAVLGRRIAEAVRLATGADLAIAGRLRELGSVPVTPGETRVADLEALFYGHTIDMLELTGSELLQAQTLVAALPEASEFWMAFHPDLQSRTIDPAGRYRVAVPLGMLGLLGRNTKLAPRSQWRTDTTVADALSRFLVQPH
jgi:hypothetical protein